MLTHRNNLMWNVLLEEIEIFKYPCTYSKPTVLNISGRFLTVPLVDKYLTYFKHRYIMINFLFVRSKLRHLNGLIRLIILKYNELFMYLCMYLYLFI